MIFPLSNPIRPYPWGSRTAIATLLGEPSPSPGPQAELWMGAHPDDPSRLPSGESLDAVIAADPSGQLGGAVVESLGPTLPFLMKVLAADAPLSLQVHPTLAQAQRGFERENARGIGQSDPARNYRDANHKPEMICALTPFLGVVGFREVHETRRLIAALNVPELARYDGLLGACPNTEGLHELVHAVLTTDCGDLVDAIAAAAERAHGFDAERDMIRRLAAACPGDAGVIVAMLLNVVRLRPGEAAFLPAGVLHMYVEGVGVEVMANSDNVLRGGLTSKHIDVPELLDILDPTPGRTPVISPVRRPSGEEVYDVPAREFRLSRWSGAGVLGGDAPRIVIAIDGAFRLRCKDSDVELKRGQSAYLPADVGEAQLDGSGALYCCAPNLDAPGVA